MADHLALAHKTIQRDVFPLHFLCLLEAQFLAQFEHLFLQVFEHLTGIAF